MSYEYMMTAMGLGAEDYSMIDLPSIKVERQVVAGLKSEANRIINEGVDSVKEGKLRSAILFSDRETGRVSRCIARVTGRMELTEFCKTGDLLGILQGAEARLVEALGYIPPVVTNGEISTGEEEKPEEVIIEEAINGEMTTVVVNGGPPVEEIVEIEAVPIVRDYSDRPPEIEEVEIEEVGYFEEYKWPLIVGGVAVVGVGVLAYVLKMRRQASQAQLVRNLLEDKS